MPEPLELRLKFTDEMSQKLEAVQAEMKAAKEALSEERIRQIVREEMVAWEKRHGPGRPGYKPPMETK